MRPNQVMSTLGSTFRFYWNASICAGAMSLMGTPAPCQSRLLSQPLVREVTVTRDGRSAFAGDSDGVISVWDLRDRKCVKTILADSKHQDASPCYAFTTDSHFAVVGYTDVIRVEQFDARLGPDTLVFIDLKMTSKTSVRFGDLRERHL